MLLSEAVEGFLISCRADGLSPASVKWYRSILRTFLRDFPPSEVERVTVADLRGYIVNLRERLTYIDAPQRKRRKPLENPPPGHKMSGFSIDSHVTALHSFWGWCEREYSIANPMANIRRPSRRQPEVKAITPEDFVKLFNACSNTRVGLRDRALLAFLADTGARLGGLVRLKWEVVDLDGRTAQVREKGQKTRKVVFTRITAQFLLAWKSAQREGQEYVFTGLRSIEPPLKSTGIEQILKRLKRRAGVTGRVNPHSFRHAFAREYLRNGGDVVTLARLLGHADVNTTAAYYAVFSHDELAELHEKYSPLKRLLT